MSAFDGNPDLIVSQPAGSPETVRSSRRRAIFCSFLWPRYPGHSGGEIRDFHLLNHLSGFLSIQAFVLHHTESDDQTDLLRSRMAAVHPPSTATEHGNSDHAQGRSLFGSLMHKARRRRWPTVGFRYHFDAEVHIDRAISCLSAIRRVVRSYQPDFIVVSPQINSLGLLLEEPTDARLILASYDVESVRMSRLAAAEKGIARLALALETRRAARFEAENLSCYDGVIAVSPKDASEFIGRYALDPQRVIAIDNSVDPRYFDFRSRSQAGPPCLTYVGNFGYSPNAQAALRLLHRIFPIVRRAHPDLLLRIVGESPTEEMLRAHDGGRVVVTGRVPDVRDELARATIGCFPLLAGSGTKFKVLECLASGVPLICSSVALEGLDVVPGTHALCSDTDEGIAAAIGGLLDDTAERARLAESGRKLIEGRYVWSAALAGLDPWLELILRLPKRPQSIAWTAR